MSTRWPRRKVLSVALILVISGIPALPAMFFESPLGGEVAAEEEEATLETKGVVAVFGDGQALVLQQPDAARSAAIRTANQPTPEQREALGVLVTGQKPLAGILTALRELVSARPAEAGPLSVAAMDLYRETTGSRRSGAAQAILIGALDSVPSNYADPVSVTVDLVALALISDEPPEMIASLVHDFLLGGACFALERATSPWPLLGGTIAAGALERFSSQPLISLEAGAVTVQLAVAKFGGADPAAFSKELAAALEANGFAKPQRASPELVDAAKEGKLDRLPTTFGDIVGGDYGVNTAGQILTDEPSAGAAGTQPEEGPDQSDNAS